MDIVAYPAIGVGIISAMALDNYLGLSSSLCVESLTRSRSLDDASSMKVKYVASSLS